MNNNNNNNKTNSNNNSKEEQNKDEQDDSKLIWVMALIYRILDFMIQYLEKRDNHVFHHLKRGGK